MVKDYAARHPATRRFIGWPLLDREARAYAALAGHPAVPRLLGRLDADALVLEFRGGTALSSRRPWTFSPTFAEELRDAVAELHARGVVHLDLRHRTNVRAGMDGHPVLIDFASAFVFRPGSLLSRVVLPVLARFDWRALEKWSPLLAGQTVDAAQLPSGSAAGSSDPSRPLPVGPDSGPSLGPPGGSSEGGRGASRPM